MQPPTLYLFAGSNGAGKSAFARAYLTTGFEPLPRFLNADEIAGGLSPLAPDTVRLRAGKLLLREIRECLRGKASFAVESTLSGHSQASVIHQARALGFVIEIHYLWIPSATLAICRIAQRVKKGGQAVPPEDVRRRYKRSLENFVHIYAPLADVWMIWDNTSEPTRLILRSSNATPVELKALLHP